MFVNEKIIKELYDEAGEIRVKKAKLYFISNKTEIEKVQYENDINFEITGKVLGQEVYKTHISVQNGEINDVTCECADYYNRYAACKHIVATMMEFSENTIYEKTIQEKNNNKTHAILGSLSKYKSFENLVYTFYNEEMLENENIEIEQNKIKIEPKLIYDKYNKILKIEFKIGNQRMYKMKNISEFYEKMKNNESFKYGNKLEFVHNRNNFDENSKLLLDFIMEQAEIIKFVNSSANSNYRYYGKALSESEIVLSNSVLDKAFDILKEKEIILLEDYEEKIIEIVQCNPNIFFRMRKSNEDYIISLNKEVKNINDIKILEGNDYTYILYKNKLYRCDEEYKRTTLKLLKIMRENYLTEIYLDENQLPELFAVVLPKLKNNIKFENIDLNYIEKYKPKKLGVKIFLDFDENGYIVADVKFCYADEEFNPLLDNIKTKYVRDIIEENKVINIFKKTGFMYYEGKECFVLPQEDKIFDFLLNDINEYMQQFEVMATENFKSKEIKKPKISSLGVKVENNLLKIDFANLNIDIDELQEIMQKYTLKKKYHKLKDGSFISLEENKDIEFIDKLITGMDISYKDLKEGEIRLPVNRSLYLNQLLKTISNTEVLKNDEYKKIIKGTDKENFEDDVKVPEILENTLRYYQKTGYKWLKTLDNYKFGGILADDMGLGKTVQMLSIITGYLEENTKRRASIVICPSSLTLNWQNEAKKFTKNIKTLVIKGTSSEREKQIQDIDKYDLVITSYDLLKRDIGLYNEKKYQFRFAIADEAQYLKNSNTQNSKAVKSILADTKYALTGTPIENSLSELWSIFDYIMPGYLFSYKKFKTIYETPIVKENDNKAMEKLKMLIEPFVLRRTKKEVLTELPEKTITVLNNQMKEEQEKIYLNYLLQAKKEVTETIETKGFEKSHIQILVALTRLRQICCHPSLFIKDYNEGSSKLEQCIEIIKDAVESGHKILLFSGYTSMFEIIEDKLNKEFISYFKLTGATKIDERIKMVDEFNENKDIKVFLISLKAGGTGLNLTGADIVIHYDPWWNASAENQATDRAYRIGQKNNVQVYKLITKNSIEEKIYQLQQKKSKLIDNVLDTKTSFISKLSKEDIMNLFN